MGPSVGDRHVPVSSSITHARAARVIIAFSTMKDARRHWYVSITHRGPHNRTKTLEFNRNRRAFAREHWYYTSHTAGQVSICLHSYTNLSGSVTGVIPVLAGECAAISIKFQGFGSTSFDKSFNSGSLHAGHLALKIKLMYYICDNSRIRLDYQYKKLLSLIGRTDRRSGRSGETWLFSGRTVDICCTLGSATTAVCTADKR
jgi:hypothetical protein